MTSAGTESQTRIGSGFIRGHGTLESSLLSLPSELRVEILRYLISKRVIYMSENRSMRGKDSLWSHGKLHSDISKLRVRCHPLEDPKSSFERQEATNVSIETVEDSTETSLTVATSLLLSCRQLYREAVAILYSENVFSFDNILTFGDLAEYSPYAILHIRRLSVRHIVPSISAYALANTPRGQAIAVRASDDGPVMFLHFVKQVMPQLQDMELSYVRKDWMANSYQVEYARRAAEWSRFVSQLLQYCDRPKDFFRGRPAGSYKKAGGIRAFGV